MKKLLISLFMAGIALTVNAQDKALLETLVKKGMITQQEAAQIAKESVAVVPGAKTTKSIKIFGGGQGWYTWNEDTVKSGTANPKQNSGFTLRYVKLGIEADVGSGWSATVITDFGTDGANRNYLDKVLASKKIDHDYISGQLDLGLRKANMGLEQNTDDFEQLAIERSVATFFFTRAGNNAIGAKNFGSRTIGIFWDGNITQVEGLYYGAAVTSELTEGVAGKNIISNVNDSASLSFYANAGYRKVAELEEESFDYDVGVNFGYAPQGMSNSSVNTKRGSIWGINPYVNVNWRGISVLAEFFLQQAEDYWTPGRNGSGHTPMGGNLTVAYKMEVGEWGTIQPVLRFAHVDTNGMGAQSEFNNLYFDNATTFYVGVNWFATSSVKTSLGYEYGYYDKGIDALTAERMYGNTFRAQVQVLF